MAKTSAERQRAYRASRNVAGEDRNGERYLQSWISTAADCALDRLARHHGKTRKAVLQSLIIDADNLIGAGMSESDFKNYMATGAGSSPSIKVGAGGTAAP